MMGLQSFIAERKKDKDLLVMAHVVCGYPSFEDNLKELEKISGSKIFLEVIQSQLKVKNMQMKKLRMQLST